MKKTCFNCKYLHGCLAEEDPSQYHIHNYCEIFKQTLPFDMDSEVNKFLYTYWTTMEKACPENIVAHDDFETGEAYCWLFQELKEAFWSDDKFEEYRKHNRDLAIKTLEYMFEKDEVWDELNEYTQHKLADYFDAEEIDYLKRLLSKLKEEAKNSAINSY